MNLLPDDTEFRNDLQDETENRIPVLVNGSSVSNLVSNSVLNYVEFDHGLYSNEFYYPTAHHTQYCGGNFLYVYNINN